MVKAPGGEFWMGSDRFYPEEAPRRRVRVSPFSIDEAPVTNREFATFIEETGCRSFAAARRQAESSRGGGCHVA
jgi:formylglycine-generating enzyme required for sulfatase activity